MEFLSGQVLSGTSYVDAFKDQEFNREIGRVIALDLLLNNFDRFPIIWQHDGNASNLMIQSDSTAAGKYKLHAIDQSYNRILNDKNAAAYLENVKSCLSEAKSGKMGAHARKLKSFVERSIDTKLSDEVVLDMMHGLTYQAQIMGTKVDLLRVAAKETEAAFTKSSTPVAVIDVSFAENVAKIMGL